MKRWTLLVAVSFVMSTAMAQDNPYIVKTKGVQREASANSQKDSEEAEPLVQYVRLERGYALHGCS